MGFQILSFLQKMNDQTLIKTEINIDANSTKKELYDVVNYHTGKPVEQIEKDFDRDKWMTAIEAKEYGLVDEVLLVNQRKEKNPLAP